MEDGIAEVAAAVSAEDSSTSVNEQEVLPAEARQEDEGVDSKKKNILPDSSEIDDDSKSKGETRKKVNPLIVIAILVDYASRHKGHLIAFGFMIHCFMSGNRGFGFSIFCDIYVAICLLMATTSLSSGKLREATQGISNMAMLLKKLGK